MYIWKSILLIMRILHFSVFFCSFTSTINPHLIYQRHTKSFGPRESQWHLSQIQKCHMPNICSGHTTPHSKPPWPREEIIATESIRRQGGKSQAKRSQRPVPQREGLTQTFKEYSCKNFHSRHRVNTNPFSPSWKKEERGTWGILESFTPK